jgi:hypothetical protein
MGFVFWVMKFSSYLRAPSIAIAAHLLVIGVCGHAQPSTNNPILAVTPDLSGTNRWNISIVNPVPRHVYRIEKRNALNDGSVWQFHAQTTSNFLIVPQSSPSQFFRAGLLTQALPEIVSFTASPATLSASGNANLHWVVNDATGLKIDNGIGDVTGSTSRVATVSATRTYTLTASNSVGSAAALATVVIGQAPSSSSGRAVNIISPITSQRFFAPGMVRIFVSAYDPTIPTNFPEDGKGGNAAWVEYLLDNEVVQSMDGQAAEYWVFRATLTNLTAGTHILRARAFYTNVTQTLILDSDPVSFTVDTPPAYAMVTNLTQDIVLTGSQSFQMLGTTSARVRINGNGFRIRTSGNWTGQFTLRYADLSSLGTFNDSTTGIDVTTTKTLTMENCTVDACGTVSFTLNGTNAASVSSNEFRSNMLMPLSQYPDEYYGAQSSFPAVKLLGDSTGQKVFCANNMGAGWLRMTGVNNWFVGGSTDAHENIFIGPRVGIMLESGANHVTLRRNYSHHVYYGGWSQGNNFELGAANDHVIVEHNIVRDSSWAVRDVACEFRYNLILGAGHQWMWITGDNAYVHHNIFAGGDADVTGIWLIYGPQNVRFWNNTVDGFNQVNGPNVLLIGTDASADVQSCAFFNTRCATTVSIEGTLTNVGYNSFYNPQVTGNHNYSDNRDPATDIGGLNVQMNPGFANAVNNYGIDDTAMWLRTTTLRQVLQMYRNRYTPATGSPLIDAGHGGNGNDIGAVGAGAPNADDQFGILTP